MSKTVRQETFIIFQLVLFSLIWAVVLSFKKITVLFSLDAAFALLDTTPYFIFVDFVFIKWAWKLPIFKHWLVLQPNINGKWTGVFVTKWKNKTMNRPFNLRVVQELFSVKCKTETKESLSKSLAGQLYFDDQHDDWCLLYTYHNIASQKYRDKSPIHFGTALLKYEKKNNAYTLSGEYWTSRKTVGDIKLKKG